MLPHSQTHADVIKCDRQTHKHKGTMKSPAKSNSTLNVPRRTLICLHLSQRTHAPSAPPTPHLGITKRITQVQEKKKERKNEKREAARDQLINAIFKARIYMSRERIEPLRWPLFLIERTTPFTSGKQIHFCGFDLGNNKKKANYHSKEQRLPLS